MTEERFVTCDQCEDYRTLYCNELVKQQNKLSKVGGKMEVFEKVMYLVLGVLVAGFTGVIFAVLQVGV